MKTNHRSNRQNRYELTKAKYLLDPEQEALVATLEKYKDTDPRDTTLLWFALHTGARASELLAVTAADLDPNEMTVFIRGLKDSDNREIPLPKWLFLRLRLLAPADGGRVFPISYNRLRQIWQHYRPVPKKFHALRHTFAINLYRKAKDILILKHALGHRSLGNTMIYAEYQYKTTELRRAILG